MGRIAFVPGSADKESLYGNDSTILVDTISSSNLIDGTVKGNIIPDANIAYDLGYNRFPDHIHSWYEYPFRRYNN